jgi:hypothetical protein
MKERNAQVSVMRTIYSNASLVRIWIYEPNIDASSEQVKRLQHFNELLDAAETKKSRRSVMASLTYWQPVLPIFENPYWHRVWMQQEVLNARMLKLHCMNIVVSHNALVQFQAVSTALQIVRSNELEHDVKANSSHYSKRLAPAMNIPNSKHTLMKLLERTAILEATDSRDKLYAIMHLAHDYNEGSIPVDYKRSVVDVMISAVRYFVEFQRTLDFLWQVDWGLERTNRASSDIQPNTTQDSDAAGFLTIREDG